MLIESVAPGSDIQIMASNAMKTVFFNTKASMPLGNTLLVDEIVNEDGEPISFVSDNVNIAVLLINNGKSPLVWRDAAIRHITMGKVSYHRIACLGDGKLYNRRESFRLPIGCGAVIQKSANSGTVTVILRDVSPTGFGFVAQEDLEMNTIVRLVATTADFAFNLSGIIVRKSEFNGKQIYGCRLNVFNRALDKYIMEKQREMLARSSGVSSGRADKGNPFAQQLKNDAVTAEAGDTEQADDIE